MRFTAPTVLTAALLLAACGKGGDSVSLKNASIDQVAATSADKLTPGEWDVSAKVTKQETRNAPAGMPPAPRMPATTMKICITPEQARRPDAMFGKGLDQFKKNCTYDKFEMAGGKMDAVMHCDIPNGPKIKSRNSGTFSATEMTSESETEVTIPGGMTMTNRTKVVAHRTGECQAGDAQAGAAKPAAAG